MSKNFPSPLLAYARSWDILSPSSCRLYYIVFYCSLSVLMHYATEKENHYLQHTLASTPAPLVHEAVNHV